MVKKFNNELNNKLLLADSGYDSKNFKSILDDKNCEYIIPINKRNKDSTEIKKLKNQMREHSNDKINSKKILLKQTKQKKEKEEIWNEIKEIRETLRIKLKGVKKSVDKKIFKGKKI